MSVMLGMVVWTLGLRSTHLSAASMAPSCFSLLVDSGCRAAHAPEAARHHLHGHDALAGLGRLVDQLRS